ncbi:MAG: (Na+)-NQR maturation NqrM [Gammaproteobacteria bacterium]
MAYFLGTFVVMLVVILIMAVGVIFGRSAIKGSCGGTNNGNCVCTEKCDKRKKMEAQGNGGSA